MIPAGYFHDLETSTTHPVHWGTPAWRAALEWMKRHGIDPTRVPAGTTVTRDARRRQIRYQRIVLNEAGKPCVDHTHPHPLITEDITEQGEAPPWPLPRELTDPEPSTPGGAMTPQGAATPGANNPGGP